MSIKNKNFRILLSIFPSWKFGCSLFWILILKIYTNKLRNWKHHYQLIHCGGNTECISQIKIQIRVHNYTKNADVFNFSLWLVLSFLNFFFFPNSYESDSDGCRLFSSSFAVVYRSFGLHITFSYWFLVKSYTNVSSVLSM